MAISEEEFLKQVLRLELVSEPELQRIRDSLRATTADDRVQELARRLVKGRHLTQHQAQQIYAGKADALELGKHLVQEKLGEGGMGLVLKAIHRRMDRIVAIKILSPKVAKNPDLLKRFHREVRAAAKLEHPNIVRAYDADESSGTHFLVMEYVAGSDLSSLVKTKGPMTAEQAIACLLQGAKGNAVKEKKPEKTAVLDSP